MWPPRDEPQLLAHALGLGARDVAGWSEWEERICAGTGCGTPPDLTALRRRVESGEDPLGEALCRLRSPEARRPLGATYTPPEIVASMVRWVAANLPAAARIVDPGAGSGRFLLAAGRALPGARLVGVEVDPVAAVIARANLAASGLASRAEIRLGDFRAARLDPAPGPSVFLGNPPYVRHHHIAPEWKTWLARRAADLGLKASGLAGLHVHFYLAAALGARPGDAICFLTAAEWLDVNYGALVRELFTGPHGGVALHVVDPVARPFPDAQATAAIACFRVGSRPASVHLRRLDRLGDLGDLTGGAPVARERLEMANRWTPLVRPARRPPEGFVELGELCRVHRGAVTGANKVWIAGPHSAALPERLLVPSVTKARELFAAGARLSDGHRLRRVIDLPAELDALEAEERRQVEGFLRVAKQMGADRGYIATHRRAWWSVGLRAPAPILATYMARRPPAFVRNGAAVRHINIAHGLYPRVPLSEGALDRLAHHLSTGVGVCEGRTYSGGLTKFEPREMERLLVPSPEALSSPG